MYKIMIYNGGIETLIHYQGVDDAPQIIDNHLKIVENQSSILNFKMYITNPGYNMVTDLVTQTKVVDTRNNNTVFEGRVLTSIPTMDESGEFYKDVVCESELGYLNDSRVGRWELHPGALPEDAPPHAEPNHSVRTAIEKIINNHNANTDQHKHFTVGTIEVEDGVYFATNYESSLDIIINKLINDNGLVIKIRKVNDVRYIDVLIDNPRVSDTIIELTTNIKNFKKTPNHTNFCTRLLAIGADGVTFADINNGKNYVENATAIAKYGIITKPFEWENVTLPENLLTKATNKLNEILTESYDAVEVTALDLSYIGLTPEQFEVGTKNLIVNEVQGFSGILKIVQVYLDLSEPWNSSLVFSSIPVTATSNSIGIQQQVNNNRIEVLMYNGRLIQKVSSVDGKFESYREQTDQAITERVTNGEFESYVVQTAIEISSKVTANDVYTLVTQNATSWKLSINGKLSGVSYEFDGTGFTLGSTANGDTALHTNQYSKWIHGDNYSIAKSTGFFINNGGGERPIKSLDYMVIRPSIPNGTTTTMVLPEDFAGKAIHTDFTVLATHGDFDSSVGARLNIDAVRTIFVEIVSWNSSTRELVVRPCMQKIGIATQTFWGWDSDTTTSGNTIGEGAIDVLVIARI